MSRIKISKWNRYKRYLGIVRDQNLRLHFTIACMKILDKHMDLTARYGQRFS